ncbi:MAG: hypothetical protein AAF802_00505 [Planctomycetota bacterium]
MSHVLNCFDILNADKLSASYRLVDVDGPFDANLGDGELAESNLQQLVKKIAFAEHIPVAIVSGGEHPVLAIPSEHSLRTSEFNLSPEVATLSPQVDEQTLDFSNLRGESERIGLAFLGWHLRGHLRRDRRLWNSNPWINFFRRPMNYRHDNRDVDIFRGFGLRLRIVDGRPCIWLKLTHKYVESDWLPDAYDTHAMQQKLRMKHALYHYGHKWFPIQLLGPSGKSISEQRFVPEGETEPISVYDWTVRAVGGPKAPAWIDSLDPDSRAIKYQYPGNQKKRFGAAALCKLMKATNDPRVSRLHRKSIVGPEVLLPECSKIIKEHLSKVDFNGIRLNVSTKPQRCRRRVFPVPPQEFGQGQTIHVGRDASLGEIHFRDLGRHRLATLLDPEAGVAVSNPLDAQYFIVPSSLAREATEDLQSRFEKTMRKLLQRGFRFDRVVYRDPKSGKLKEQVDAIVSAIDKAKVKSGRGVLVLPATAEPDLHNFLKKKLRDRIQFQCLDANKVDDFYSWKISDKGKQYRVRDGMNGRYQSYLRYAAMGVLMVNRQWPWVLAENTHYDMYIGLDVLHSTAAFTFFSDGGRQCFMHSVDSTQREKLLRNQVRSVIYTQLLSLLQSGSSTPRSIVLRRDGRSFGTERRGFREAIQRLIKEGHLADDTTFGVVEVHKSSAEGYRLVDETRDGKYRNPTAGAWAEIDDREGIVCTTGFPFKFPGTAKPLCVRIVEGPLELPDVLEDTFGMSQLCWSAPDRCMRLSIDLKLCDDHLRSIASFADEDEGQFGDSEEEWGEQKQAVGWSA